MALSLTYDGKLRTSKLPVNITITGATRAIIGFSININSTTIGPLEYAASGGSITVDISKIITADKYEHFTKTFTSDLVKSQTVVFPFTITYYERAIDSATKYGETTSASFNLIHAEFDELLNEKYGSFDDYLSATGNLLLSHSNIIITNRSICNRLYFICKTTGTYELNVNNNILSLGSLTANTIYEIFPCLYSWFGLYGDKLSISVQNDSHVKCSQAITYNKMLLENLLERNWLFLNSQGVYEHITTTGKFSKTTKNKNTVKELNPSQKATYTIKRSRIINKPSNDVSWTGNTGNMPISQQTRVEEFINSKDVYLFIDQEYVPVNIVSASFEDHADDEFIVSAKIEFEPAFKSAQLLDLSGEKDSEKWATAVLNDLRVKYPFLTDAEFAEILASWFPYLLDKTGDYYPTYGPYSENYTTSCDILTNWALTIIADYKIKNSHIDDDEWDNTIFPYLFTQFVKFGYYRTTFAAKTVADFFYYFKGRSSSDDAYKSVFTSSTPLRWLVNEEVNPTGYGDNANIIVSSITNFDEVTVVGITPPLFKGYSPNFNLINCTILLILGYVDEGDKGIFAGIIPNYTLPNCTHMELDANYFTQCLFIPGNTALSHFSLIDCNLSDSETFAVITNFKNYYSTHAPTANLILFLYGDGMGTPSTQEGYASIVSALTGYFTSAGKTLTLVVNN